MFVKPQSMRRDGRTIGERARAIREAAGLSQVSVAQRAQWHVTDLCNLERGRGPKSPGINRVRLLAAALGVSVDELAGHVAPRRPRAA